MYLVRADVNWVLNPARYRTLDIIPTWIITATAPPCQTPHLERRPGTITWNSYNARQPNFSCILFSVEYHVLLGLQGILCPFTSCQRTSSPLLQHSSSKSCVSLIVFSWFSGCCLIRFYTPSNTTTSWVSSTSAGITCVSVSIRCCSCPSRQPSGLQYSLLLPATFLFASPIEPTSGSPYPRLSAGPFGFYCFRSSITFPDSLKPGCALPQ